TLAAFAPEDSGMIRGTMLRLLIETAIFVSIGLVVFVIAFFVMTKLAPFSVRKEIEDDQNTALGIVMGSVIIGLAIIIAAAIGVSCVFRPLFGGARTAPKAASLGSDALSLGLEPQNRSRRVRRLGRLRVGRRRPLAVA